jgi:hypothetical protein
MCLPPAGPACSRGLAVHSHHTDLSPVDSPGLGLANWRAMAAPCRLVWVGRGFPTFRCAESLLTPSRVLRSWEKLRGAFPPFLAPTSVWNAPWSVFKFPGLLVVLNIHPPRLDLPSMHLGLGSGVTGMGEEQG